MREVHCNLQIIRAFEVSDNLKVDFGFLQMKKIKQSFTSSFGYIQLCTIQGFDILDFLSAL